MKFSISLLADIVKNDAKFYWAMCMKATNKIGGSIAIETSNSQLWMKYRSFRFYSMYPAKTQISHSDAKTSRHSRVDFVFQRCVKAILLCVFQVIFVFIISLLWLVNDIHLLCPIIILKTIRVQARIYTKLIINSHIFFVDSHKINPKNVRAKIHSRQTNTAAICIWVRELVYITVLLINRMKRF